MVRRAGEEDIETDAVQVDERRRSNSGREG